MRHRPFTLACGFMLMLGMAGSGVSSEYRGRMMFLGRPRLSTIDANLPASGANTLGRTILFNTAVDYRIKGKIWPMLEQNSKFWSGGVLDGKKQVFLLPGRPGF
jgi:hypothetical protein